ncbi:MAG TPA: hypothetical protein VGX16_06620, partial [Solirubrobacteraceae bacterium]|nr:hypothetical protein [Solirubrobacteraceae bacterium]
ELTIPRGARVEPAREVLARGASGEVHVDPDARRLTAPVEGGAGRLAELVRELDEAGVRIEDLAVRRPTLDDVFLALTGHEARDAREATEEAAR